MKASEGGAMLFYIVIFFVGAVIFMFVNILSFYKAFRVKNRIVNILETSDLTGSALMSLIDSDLKDYGYKVAIEPPDCASASKSGTSCDSPFAPNTSSYKYCVCKISDNENGGYHYEVITFTQFEFPIIGDLLTYPVRGETRVLGIEYDK